MFIKDPEECYIEQNRGRIRGAISMRMRSEVINYVTLKKLLKCRIHQSCKRIIKEIFY